MKKTVTPDVPARAKARAPELPTQRFADAGAWADWLAANHALSSGVWLQIAKGASGEASVTYAEALLVALSWGWIDGQKGRLDDDWWLQKFTHRTPKSPWSKINREKALSLIAAGDMKAPGLAEVERAKSDGRWQAAYDGQSRSVVPDDLRRALATNAEARAFFETLDARNRYAITYRLQTAKKPETREKRLVEFLAMLRRREKLHP